MKRLIQCEWERLWRRKTTWLLFMSIPVILIAAASFLRSQNKIVSDDLPQYTVAWNFPILGLSEMLITAFQAIVLIIVVLMVTEEYRTGQIRMILIRSYCYTEIMIAKFIVASLTIFLYFVVYLLISQLLGMILFANVKQFPLFYHQQLVNAFDGLIYNFKFYGIAFITALAILSVMFFIATISRTTTSAIGVGIGFILLSLVYPIILQFFHNLLDETLYAKLHFISIPMIQYEGITLMLAEKPYFVSWNFFVISSYILLFTCLTFFITRRKQSFI